MFSRYVIRLVAFPSQRQSTKAARNTNPAKRSRTEKTIDIDSWVLNKDDAEHRNARDTVGKLLLPASVYHLIFANITIPSR